MVRLVAVVALAGCGRQGFDQVTDADRGSDAPLGSDATLGHDEDGDGIADVTDVCPGVADPAQSDPDGDGVGDACDPDPSTPSQTIALFAPLVGADSRFATVGAWTLAADAWVFAGGGFGGIHCAMALADTDIWAGVDVTAVSPAMSRQIAIHLGPELDPHFYAELFEVTGSENDFKLTRHAGGVFTSVATQPLAGPIHPGALTLHVQGRVGPRQLAFEGGWPGEPYLVMGSAPEYVGGNGFDLNAVQVAVQVRYIMVIATSP